jgi:hypothetical protein
MEVGRILIPDQPRHKISENPSTKKLSMVVHACDPSNTEGMGRRITI